MKKKLIKSLIIVSVILIVFSYLQYGRKEKVLNSFSSTSAGVRNERLTIIANRLFIYDKEQHAKELINKALNDSLNRFCFSWDLGTPHSIEIDVYTNEIAKRNGTVKYTVIYHPIDDDASYNVIDNADNYILEIKD